jgi:hypothetical protein
MAAEDLYAKELRLAELQRLKSKINRTNEPDNTGVLADRLQQQSKLQQINLSNKFAMINPTNLIPR